jgi:hypothetical protein
MFLKALAETGNQTLSAERAKGVAILGDAAARVRSGVRCRRARGMSRLRAQEQLRQDGEAEAGTRPLSPKWRYMDGHELVVRGTGDGIGGRRRVQVARARVKGWNPRTEERFLEALGATCNVRAACAAVGLSVASVYNHRYRWPAFARRWDETASFASERIQNAMFQAGANLYSSETVPVDVAITEMTADHAIQLLRHFVAAPRPGRRAGRPAGGGQHGGDLPGAGNGARSASAAGGAAGAALRSGLNRAGFESDVEQGGSSAVLVGS